MSEAPETALTASAAKKAAKKAEKEALKEQKQNLKAQQEAEAKALLQATVENIHEDYHGYYTPFTLDPAAPIPLTRSWKNVKELGDNDRGEYVWVRGYLQDQRGKGNLGFLVLRDEGFTVQVALDSKEFVQGEALPSQAKGKSEFAFFPSVDNRKKMMKWVFGIPTESVVEVYGLVVEPAVPIKSTTQTIELLGLKVFCVSKALNELPFQMRDAMVTEGSQDTTENNVAINSLVRVLQDVRLDNRVLDLRTPASQSIFKINSVVCHLYRNFLIENEFVEIHTPKLIGGSSEGGANVFSLKYFDRDASLAQSPQLYKQMAVAGGFNRVFEIGPVFRAENSNTHRHLCEFTGLDLEMTYRDSFLEVVGFIDKLFQNIFGALGNKNGKGNLDVSKQIEAVMTQYPHETFAFLPGKTPFLTFEEAIDLLESEGGIKDIPQDINKYDFSTEYEKLLGKIVKQKYNTDFYAILFFPLASRAFYSMPTKNIMGKKRKYQACNSYDFYMRGEEILSGAQRINDPKLLTERAKAVGVEPSSIQFYINTFNLASPPTAGAGIGLERVIMLYLGLNNIRKTSMFPRDPKRLSP